VEQRVRQKLADEPVESYCIDFEDGYGERSDEEEDQHAVAVAEEIAAGLEAETLPAFIGIRIKPLNEISGERGLHTLERLLGALLEKTGGLLPQNFSITLPKVTATAQVTMLLEQLNGYDPIPIELMIETPEAVLLLGHLVAAAGERCAALHFGAYDFTAGMGITAAHQRLDHPFCDTARALMSMHAAVTGVRLCDGATSLLPIGDREAVHRGWRAHYDAIRRSLSNGFYQSWDLHPAQLPARYASVFSFFEEGLEDAGKRLRNFNGASQRATHSSGVFDDAATVEGLRNFFRRAIDCGAISGDEARDASGMEPEEFEVNG
jgi:citrate lyase beta subunit